MAKTNFLGSFLTSFTFTLVLLILLAGVNKNILPGFYFFKANVTGLSIPGSLANSTFLQDIGAIAGSDLTGRGETEASLGLSDHYTISLFGYCAKGGAGDRCSAGKIGFNFNPLRDLKLSRTVVESALSKLSPYQKGALFLGIGYIIAELFVFITLILTFFSRAATIRASAVTSSVGTLFLISSSSAALAIFIKYNGSLNSALSTVNAGSSLGKRLFILSWVATIASLLCSVVLVIHARRLKPYNRRGGGLLDESAMDKSAMDPHAPKPGSKAKPGFLAKIPTWNRHKYGKIDEDAAARGGERKTKVLYDQDDADVLISRGFGGGDDEEDERDLVRGATNQPRGIQLQPMGGGNLPSRDIDTAYEPYRAQAL